MFLSYLGTWVGVYGTKQRVCKFGVSVLLLKEGGEYQTRAALSPQFGYVSFEMLD